MANVAANETAVTRIARQSNPVAMKALRNGGVTHGTDKTTGETKCKTVATYPIVTDTIGANKIGMKKSEFKTNGIPNITGSLILKIPGATDSLATVL